MLDIQENITGKVVSLVNPKCSDEPFMVVVNSVLVSVSDTYIIENEGALTFPDEIAQYIEVIDLCGLVEDENLKSVNFPSSVEEIRGEVFNDCINLESITMNGFIPEIDYTAFEYAFNIREIIVHNVNAKQLQEMKDMLPEKLQDKVISNPNMAHPAGANFLSRDVFFSSSASSRTSDDSQQHHMSQDEKSGMVQIK